MLGLAIRGDRCHLIRVRARASHTWRPLSPGTRQVAQSIRRCQTRWQVEGSLSVIVVQVNVKVRLGGESNKG